MVDKVSRLVYICINDSIILVLEHKMIMAACARNMILQLVKPITCSMRVEKNVTGPEDV